MKIFRGLQIQEVVDKMNEIMFSTDLTNETDSYSHLLGYGAMFLGDETICIMTDDMNSFLLAMIDDHMIEVDMWAGKDNKISFKDMFQYINVLKNLFDDNQEITIRANFRITTSLPIMQRLIKRYGMEVEYMDEEENGFRVMSIIYDPTR